MINIIELVLKDSLFPIMTESCYNAGREIWKTNKLAAIILFIAGFLLTKIGIILLTLTILGIKYRQKIKDFFC